ncbi:MAG: hypothetical protein EOM72_01105 [Opitutae bacterium]|nr:hypothetical protein [Opitutae bacterium]
MKIVTGSMGLLVGMAMAAHAQTVVSLPPFTVYGVAKSWNGRAYSSNDNATVIAKINGMEMDRCNVVSGIYPDLNYRIHIPMASAPVPGKGSTGDPIAFEVLYDGQTHAVPPGETPPVVGQTGMAMACNLVVGTDVDGDGMPDEYENLLLPYYVEAGRGTNIWAILPTDDFDGDGYSNEQELWAGTIPVEESDFLKIDDFRKSSAGLMALKFLAAPGRTYEVPQTEHLVSHSWTASELSLATNVPPSQPFYSSPSDAYVTLYLLPTNNVSFRLDVK